MVIYKLTNTINNKCYIGQTKDFEQRMRAHKSDATNKKSHCYNFPLYKAVRKYGWENFTKEIIDECPSSFDEKQEKNWANEKEIYYIKKYDSLAQNKGYNISLGGGGFPREKMTFEEKINNSSILAPEEIKDIQQLLISGMDKADILKKYSPKLKDSFLDNINSGENFYNPKLKYPLFDYLHSGRSRKFSKSEQLEIQEDIMSGMIYADIIKKWEISQGLLSLINNGTLWHNDTLKYPLCIKGCSRIHNWETWVKDVIKDLEESNLNLIEISKKYDKAYSTIKKINEGRSYKDPSKKYPLTKNRKK